MGLRDNFLPQFDWLRCAVWESAGCPPDTLLPGSSRRFGESDRLPSESEIGQSDFSYPVGSA